VSGSTEIDLEAGARNAPWSWSELAAGVERLDSRAVREAIIIAITFLSRPEGAAALDLGQGRQPGVDVIRFQRAVDLFVADVLEGFLEQPKAIQALKRLRERRPSGDSHLAMPEVEICVKKRRSGRPLLLATRDGYAHAERTAMLVAELERRGFSRGDAITRAAQRLAIDRSRVYARLRLLGLSRKARTKVTKKRDV
jgi:hypothetical protein